MLGGDIGVVVVAIHIGADAVAIVVADAGAAIERAGATAVGVHHIIDGTRVAVIAGIAGLGGGVGVVVVAIHIRADAVAVGIADAGAGSGVPAQPQSASTRSLMVVLSPSSQASPMKAERFRAVVIGRRGEVVDAQLGSLRRFRRRTRLPATRAFNQEGDGTGGRITAAVDDFLDDGAISTVCCAVGIADRQPLAGAQAAELASGTGC